MTGRNFWAVLHKLQAIEERLNYRLSDEDIDAIQADLKYCEEIVSEEISGKIDDDVERMKKNTTSPFKFTSNSNVTVSGTNNLKAVNTNDLKTDDSKWSSSR